jgi:hypothetical protein
VVVVVVVVVMMMTMTVMMMKSNVYRILVRRRWLGRLRHRWENNIEMHLQ